MTKMKMNKAAPVPTSSEMRNIMESVRSYLDEHSNGVEALNNYCIQTWETFMVCYIRQVIADKKKKKKKKTGELLSIAYFKYLNRWTATAGSDVVQSGRPIFDDFFQHLWPYIGNNTANVVFQMVKRLWLIRIDQ
ncbi:hypothetical protein TNCV_3493101 [Trichonephila clavipes]|nr:hypothetical protein TNCV_3493101 [Trichonephila clavipes]